VEKQLKFILIFKKKFFRKKIIGLVFLFGGAFIFA